MRCYNLLNTKLANTRKYECSHIAWGCAADDPAPSCAALLYARASEARRTAPAPCYTATLTNTSIRREMRHCQAATFRMEIDREP